MDRMSVEDTLFPGCPIRNVLARIGDKWSLLVLYTLDGAEPMRFDRYAADAGRGRLSDAEHLSGGSASCGVCADGAGQIAVAAYQQSDCLGY